MNWILKNKNKSKKTLLVVLFLVSFFSLFYSSNIVKAQTAAEQQAANAVQQKINSTGSAFGTPGSVGYDPAKQNEPQGTSTVVPGKTAASVQPNDYKKPMAGTCGFADFECYFKKMLIGVFNAVGWLFAIAATLFTWVIDPANISGEGTGVLQKQAVKDVWIMVRDLLNMTFILILLFAAFCTIFQVEKWNLKKVWLNILINALLVNFSYPIARFFIDVSNVAFYYFVNNLFTSTGTTVVDGSSIMASFGAASNLGTILRPENYAAFSVAYLIMMIVVVFIMGMTLLVVAALFLVRLIALTMLVMFSPIGFVGYIFPSTASFADDWWKKLFSYSFFAPIMIFGMAISLKITEAIGQENMRSFKAAASANTPIPETTFIANVAFVFVPIITIWGTIGVAKSMGIEGADKVTGWAKDFSTWVGMKLSGAAFVGDAYKAYSSRRDQAKGDKLSNRLGNWGGSQQDRLRGLLPGGQRAAQRYQSGVSAQVADAAKLHDTANMTEDELRDLSVAGDKFASAAALLEIAIRGRTTGPNGTLELDQIRNNFGENSQVFKQMQNKVKAYDPSAAFAHIANPVARQARIAEQVNSNQFDAKKLNASALGNAEFMEVALANGAISPDDLRDLAKKSGTHAANITRSLSTIADETVNDANGNALLDHAGNAIHAHENVAENENDRNIHLAHVQATGTIHASLNTAGQRAQIFSRLNKDNAKRLTTNSVGPGGAIIPGTIETYAAEICQNINHGNFKEIISNMNNNAARQALVHAVLTQPPSAAVNRLTSQIATDPYLSSLV